MKNHYIIPIFIPHRGCPHDCVFCNQRKITGLDTEITSEQIIDIIEGHLNTISDSVLKEIAFFGGSFTGLDLKVQQSFLNIAKNYKDEGKIDKIRLSTRPDYIDKEIIENLKAYGVDIIELGVQSLDKEVLNSSNRGHTVEDVYRAVDMIKANEFELGLQMMVGLVGDTYNKSLYTVKKFIELNPDFVRIYPTLIIRQTYLETLYIKKIYKPFTLEDTIDYIKDYLMLFKYFDIPVIRIGLQPTKNISFEEDVVAGPLHPSIRQIIESKLYGEIIKLMLIEKRFNTNNLIIKLNSKSVSQFVGYKGENLKKLKKKYNIKIIETNNVNKIEINDGYEKYLLDEKYFIKKYLCKHNIICS
ncbi:elongator complex protein 3 [Senegalia massiliensis]|uniref:elongator complex protein 3 n=1 Tax=Senegalia massiliensis TaxID=1720316 RepID=UPI0010307335|nr:radical SAM protein [Senegalia massiliensis]